MIIRGVKMNDGLQSGEFIAATLSGATLSVGNSQISSAELGSGAVLSANISGAQILASHQKFVGTGSPTTFGTSAQFGAFVTDAGSAATVAFGTAYAAAPICIVGLGGGATATWIRVVGTSAGSLVVHTQAASQSGTFVCIGSGAL